ncbi:MAG: PKD domain-containing protein [Candidatus Bipolaricaulota bacterium]
MKQGVRWAIAGMVLAALLAAGGCKLLNSPPVANFTWSPMEPLARTEVRFESTSTDTGGLFGGGGIVSYNWDFDDGDSASSANPKHEFTKSGEYDVTLTVTDGSGASHSVTKRVEITASLDGTWRGYIVDPGLLQTAMDLVINHSASGGIQGTAYMLQATLTCSGMSFNPTTKQVRFDLVDLGIRLDGTLDASETRIQGSWSVLGAPLQVFTWDVQLQN